MMDVMDQPELGRRITTRLTPATYQAIVARARKADVDPSHMARRMFAYALLTMPDDWVPTTGGAP